VRKIFGLTFAFSAILALIVGVAFAWSASTAATTSSATGGTLSVAPYGAAPTSNQLYPTGNPIAVLTGQIQNNTPANPGVNVMINSSNPGAVVLANTCASSGQVVATDTSQVAPGNAGGGWEVDLTMPGNAPDSCKGAPLPFAYTINVVTP